MSDAVTDLLDLADLATPMAVRVAATLRLADAIPAAGATAEEITGRLGTDPAATARLLALLAAAGVLTGHGGRYRTTRVGDALRSGDWRVEMLDVAHAGGRAELSFVELLHTVRTGAPAFPVRYGRDFWTDLADDPARQASFDAQMTDRFRTTAPAIAAGWDWSRFRTIVDVGGGRGSLLAAILREHGGVRGTLVDMAPAAEHARRTFEQAGVADRADAVAGSFFDRLPAGADAYLLSDVLHDWDDAHAHRVLATVAAAAGQGAAVLVVEPLGSGEVPPAVDLAMLAFYGGRERDLDELAALAAPHGLRVVRHARVAADRTLVELVSAGGNAAA